MKGSPHHLPGPLGLFLAVALGLWTLGGAASSHAQAEADPAAETTETTMASWPIRVAMQPVPLDAEQPKRRELGTLSFLRGYALTSPHPAFGGFSGLACLSDNRLLAISDRGHWLAADLELDAEGRLERLTNTRMGPLLDDDGAPVQGRERRDAEEMALGPSGEFLVAFEGTHRIEAYGAAGTPGAESLQVLPASFPSPKSIAEAGDNEGFEAMTWLHDGRLLLLTEGLRQEDGTLRGWLGTPADTAEPGKSSMEYKALSLQPSGPFQPTAATTLPEGSPWAGDAVILQRHYTPETGTRVGVFRLSVESLSPGAKLSGEPLAQLEGSVTVDNFEGLAACDQGTGPTALYLISDDNFNEAQRTLLLQFALKPSSSRPK